MKVVKQTDEYTIYQRRDKRFAVTDTRKRPVNGEEKVRILLAEELIKAPVRAAKPAEAEPATADGALVEEGPAAGEVPAEEDK